MDTCRRWHVILIAYFHAARSITNKKERKFVKTNYGIVQVVTLLLSITANFEVKAQSTNVNVWAWGDNTYGQCNIPTDLTNAIFVNSPRVTTGAIRSSGIPVFWGFCSSDSCTVPSDLTNVIQIAVDSWGFLALRSDSTVYSWGGLPEENTNRTTNKVTIIVTAVTTFRFLLTIKLILTQRVIIAR